MKYLFILFILGLAVSIHAQTYSLSGRVFDEKGKPQSFSTAVLLNSVDSTLEFYAITNTQGEFVITNAKKGDYLLQIAFMGFETIYKPVHVPLEKGSSLGTFVMKEKEVELGEVTVEGDYVPLSIKKDTIEFNAKAFKTKPGAVAEDLLKKLPGINVDRAGNIKAMGKDVSKVLVDGKEFFGNDPKVATKNLPADAINKVQLYDKKSDESEFTGIDDGVRDKTLNIKLKEDKKNAIFGDVTAGYGTNEHYQGSAKAYKFTKNNQLAALGMINNINQFGFSFGDYLNFNGGIASMMHGGGSAKIEITNDNSFPVNFGQPVTGLTTSGGGGINYSHSKDENNRVFISYLGNGADKDLIRSTKTESYTQQGNYLQNDSLLENRQNFVHRVNFGLRNRLDSSQNIIINGGLTYSLGNTNSNSFSESLLDASMVNTLSNLNQSDKSGLTANFSGTYQKTLSQKRTALKLSVYGSYSKSIDNTNFSNSLWTLDGGMQPVDNQFLDNTTNELSYSVKTGITQKIGKYYYIEPQVYLGTSDENLDRIRGNLALSDEVISSLSPNFEKKYQWIRPGINLKRNTDKTQLNIGLRAERGQMNSKLWDEDVNQTSFWYFTPRLSCEYEYKTGRRLNFFYSSSVNTPSSNQLLPVVNNINPLSEFYGNPDLKPEYAHSANLQWWIFDQFSFTSLMLSLNGTYTVDKINWKSSVDENLIQSSTLINVNDDYRASANVDFSTPIKKLGLKVDLSIEESWNKGINYINDIENENTNLSHRFSLSFENRKKKKWDVVTGAGVTLQNSWYSVQNSLNNHYFDFSWFGEIRFNPSDSWNFEVIADVTNYNDLGFDKSIQVPLLSAEISYHFLKNKRAQLSLNGYDLLNQNTGVQRLNELNYLRVIQSNSIGRYVMLSFKFRLNKFGGNGNGIEVKMKR